MTVLPDAVYAEFLMATSGKTLVMAATGTAFGRYPRAGAGSYPAATQVLSGVVYGGGSFTGNLTLPAVTDVRSGVLYGANGTQYLGTYVGGGGTVLFVIDDY